MPSLLVGNWKPNQNYSCGYAPKPPASFGHVHIRQIPPSAWQVGRTYPSDLSEGPNNFSQKVSKTTFENKTIFVQVSRFPEEIRCYYLQPYLRLPQLQEAFRLGRILKQLSGHHLRPGLDSSGVVLLDKSHSFFRFISSH